MFPSDLIGKLIETVLGELGKDILARNRDPKRRLARELLAYYEVIKEYRASCTELLSLLERERRLIPNKRISLGAAKEIQQLSDKMTKLVGQIVGTFESEWCREFRTSRIHGRPSRHKTKRYHVLEIYDPRLAELAAYADGLDTLASSLASSLSQQHVDWETQELTLLDPAADFKGALQAIRESWRRRGHLAAPFRTIHLTNDDDFDILRGVLRETTDVIDRTLEGVAAFLRTHFEIGDLL